MGISISVIIPSYKPQDYIWQCLDSLSSQTLSYEDYEVIVVLNGCKSPYFEDLQGYKSNTKMNLVIVQTDQGGVSNARNIGFDKSKGQYITYIDDDDYVSPNYLQGLFDAADSNIVSVANAVAFMDGTQEEVKDYHISNTYRRYVNRGLISPYKVHRYFSGPWMKLIPRSFIQGRLFDTSFKNGEDSLFMFLISDKIKQVRFANPESIYYRRFRHNSASLRRRSYMEKMKNSMKLSFKLFKIYFNNPHQYSFLLLLRKQLGLIWVIYKG